jgi:hypothetical protein
MSDTPKYAPANAEGLKPYVVTIQDWDRERDRLVYAENPAGARWKALGRGAVHRAHPPRSVR